MAPPSCESILHLYGATMRTARSFSSYNFREYFLRRAKSTFREMQREKDAKRLTMMYENAVKEHTVLQRGAIVNRLYGGWRLVVENQKPARTRGDT
ncbi:hypothetical protein DFH11DRAFT_1609056 [Phellopilus nigrolimitatus]|nr:hypothetical protein DFH11DRAFT_1609056 [Phellopilus nigrolimitatus]